LRGPRIEAGVRSDVPVSLVDVVPTVLDLAGLASPEGLQGASLRPALEGGTLPHDRAVFFNWLGGPPRVGVRRGALKLIRAGQREELFDLAADPGARQPLPADGDAAAELRAVLDAHLAASARHRETVTPRSGGDTTPAVPSRVEESLRALGYL